jgi:hypothetical protein
MRRQCQNVAGALGVCALLFVAAPVHACWTNRIDADARIASVYDGDTVRLTDGRGLRLIGLDTLELGHDGAPDQAYTQRATDALRTYSHSMITRCCCAMTWKAAITMRAGSACLYLPDPSSVTADLL